MHEGGQAHNVPVLVNLELVFPISVFCETRYLNYTQSHKSMNGSGVAKCEIQKPVVPTLILDLLLTISKVMLVSNMITLL